VGSRDLHITQSEGCHTKEGWGQELKSTLNIIFKYHRLELTILNNCSIVLLLWTFSLHVCTIYCMYILLNLTYTKRFAHLYLGYKLSQSFWVSVQIYMLEAKLLLFIIIVMTFAIFSISSGVFSLLGTLFLSPWCFQVT
jgi:hypothetical protein